MPESSPESEEVTQLLDKLHAGDAQAREQLFQRLDQELRRLAAGLLRRERPDHTLQPTALVNEAVLRLLGKDLLGQAPNRRYVFGAAARAMEQILVDHARKRQADKRGGRRERVSLEGLPDSSQTRRVDVLALHEALEQLAALSARQSEVMRLRYFGGFTVQEVADILQVSVSCIEGDSRLARAWLRQRRAAGP
jgi:RNA polymerase sigma factor (TIGR02999 family)